MNDDIYFEILKRLAKSGLNQKTDISDLLRIYLSNNIDLGESIKNGIYTYLQNMELYSHIGFKNNTVVFEENNLNEISVSAWILPAGLIFYQQKIQIDVITNSNNLSRWNIFATLCLALLSLLISAFGAYKQITDMSSKQEIETLKLKIFQQDKILLQQHIQKNQTNH